MRDFLSRQMSIGVALILMLVVLAASMLFTWFLTDRTTVSEEAIVKRIQEQAGNVTRSPTAVSPEQQQAQVEANAEKQRLAAEKAKNIRRVKIGRDHISGDPSASISIVEYSDFECPFCKRFHATPKELVASYGGKVNWVYRHFPLQMHNPGAQKEAEASECANELGGNDVFWKYIDALYSRTLSNGTGFPIPALQPLAVELGLNGERFKQCLESGRHAPRVQEDVTEGIQIGITGTPSTILLNNKTGETVVQKGTKAAALKAAIDKMLGS